MYLVLRRKLKVQGKPRCDLDARYEMQNVGGLEQVSHRKQMSSFATMLGSAM